MDRKILLSSIPKVDEVLCCSEIEKLNSIAPRVLIVDSVREVLDEIRQRILNGTDEEIEGFNIDMDEIAYRVEGAVKTGLQPHLKRVINCTGIIIHTNLGRAVLCNDAVNAILRVAGNYSNLEYDLACGERGSRYSHMEDIIKRITGAEAAMAVNNNAAAVLLVLSTMCRGREAVVSRGELVEIGGSFRIPEVMEQSGAILKEVGSTNRTHLYDYENALNENTGVLLKVHTSNYRILGFTEEVSGRELSELGKKRGIPVVEDIGSGSFIDFSKYGLSYEPTVQEAISSGIDIVTFSGDKMLGGPQAGIIAGKKEYIDRMKRNPLTRALRIDKMTIAALEATLKKYIDEEEAVKSIPVISMITEKSESVKERAGVLLDKIKNAVGDKAEVSVLMEHSQIGGGAMPLENLPTYALSVKPHNLSVNKLEQKLREAEVPIIVRAHNDSILIDVRTVKEDEYSIISSTLRDILQEEFL